MWDRLQRLAHGVVCWAVFLSVSAANVLVGLLLQALALPLDPDRRTSLAVNHAFWGRALWRLQPAWSLRARGLERLPPGPAVYVANHTSVLDIPAMMHLPRPLRVVGKASLLAVPVMGRYMRFSRQIALDATSAGSVQAALEAAHATLRRGISLLVFPEGTRSPDGRLQRFHRGAFRIAKDAGVPVVPVAIRGTGPIMPKGILWPRPTRSPVTLQVLEPVDPAGFTTARALGNHVHRALAATLHADRADSAA